MPAQSKCCPSPSFPLKHLADKLVSQTTEKISTHSPMTAKLNSIERDARVMQLSEALLEIEQRLVPTGLHIFGRAAELREKADLLRMVAAFDRPEHGARALPSLVADALGIER